MCTHCKLMRMYGSKPKENLVAANRTRWRWRFEFAHIEADATLSIDRWRRNTYERSWISYRWGSLEGMCMTQRHARFTGCFSRTWTDYMGKKRNTTMSMNISQQWIRRFYLQYGALLFSSKSIQRIELTIPNDHTVWMWVTHGAGMIQRSIEPFRRNFVLIFPFPLQAKRLE